MNNLYAYFGSFGTNFKLDVPGHTFYQIGLLDSIRRMYGDGQKFEVFSYISDVEPLTCDFPTDNHGKLMFEFAEQNIDALVQDLNQVLDYIKAKKYNKIFLKARFRNLSSLSKGLTDTWKFEEIIKTIIDSKFPTQNAYIVDTDLSLPASFKSFAEDHGIKIIVPSIDFPGISEEFASSFIELNLKEKFKGGLSSNVIFYGNVDANNYKAGHEKSQILKDVLFETERVKTFTGKSPKLSIVAKITPELREDFEESNTHLIERGNRLVAWDTFKNSNVCLNVTKNKYNQYRFIPARIYEAVIFGAIPVSYNFSWLEPGLSFESEFQYSEVLKFLMDLSTEEQGDLYKKIALKVARFKEG